MKGIIIMERTFVLGFLLVSYFFVVIRYQVAGSLVSPGGPEVVGGVEVLSDGEIKTQIDGEIKTQISAASEGEEQSAEGEEQSGSIVSSSSSVTSSHYYDVLLNKTTADDVVLYDLGNLGVPSKIPPSRKNERSSLLLEEENADYTSSTEPIVLNRVSLLKGLSYRCRDIDKLCEWVLPCKDPLPGMPQSDDDDEAADTNKGVGTLSDSDKTVTGLITASERDLEKADELEWCHQAKPRWLRLQESFFLQSNVDDDEKKSRSEKKSHSKQKRPLVYVALTKSDHAAMQRLFPRWQQKIDTVAAYRGESTSSRLYGLGSEKSVKKWKFLRDVILSQQEKKTSSAVTKNTNNYFDLASLIIPADDDIIC